MVFCRRSRPLLPGSSSFSPPFGDQSYILNKKFTLILIPQSQNCLITLCFLVNCDTDMASPLLSRTTLQTTELAPLFFWPVHFYLDQNYYSEQIPPPSLHQMGMTLSSRMWEGTHAAPHGWKSPILMNSLGSYLQLYTHTVFFLKQFDFETLCRILCHNMCRTFDFAITHCQHETGIIVICQLSVTENETNTQ